MVMITKGALWILIVFSVSSSMAALHAGDTSHQSYGRKIMVDIKKIAETIRAGGAVGGVVGGGGSSGGGGVVSSGSGGVGSGGGGTSTTGGGSSGRGSSGSSGSGRGTGGVVGGSGGSSQTQSAKSSYVRTDDPLVGAIAAMTACIFAAVLLN